MTNYTNSLMTKKRRVSRYGTRGIYFTSRFSRYLQANFDYKLDVGLP